MPSPVRVHSLAMPFAAALLLAACSPPTAPAAKADEAAAPSPPVLVGPEPNAPPPATPSGDFVWPASVAAFGDGYPHSGDPCRNLGEGPATGEYLDHTQDLVGCPGGPDTPAARALIAAGGHLVGQADGVTMISMPRPPGSPE